jgi:hypothetical protein
MAVVPDHVLLQKGINTLAAEVHQVHPDSTDMIFDLSLWVYTTCSLAPSPAPTPMPATAAPSAPASDTPASLAPSGVTDTDAKPTSSKSGDNTDGNVDADTTSSSSWIGMLFTGLGVGLLMLVAFVIWKRMSGKARATSATRTQRTNYADTVDAEVDADVPPTAPLSPASYA